MSPARSPITVDLWVWRLDCDAATLGRYRSLLSALETSRADRFVNPRHGADFTVAHGRLREILSSYAHTPAHELVFATSAHGKPFLTGDAQRFHFNLSHSGAYAAIGVSTDAALGVDIEVSRFVEDGLAERFFAAEEIAALAGEHDAGRRAAFFRCWTRKEAVVKASGEGLSLPLTSFAVDIADASETSLVRAFPGQVATDWRVLSFLPAPDCAGAIALKTGGRRVTLVRRS